MKICLVTIAVYMTAVIICIFQGFNFEGSIEGGWIAVLLIITFPWSMITIPFMWALIHGAGLELYAVIYVFFAIINSYLIYKMFAFKKPSEMP
jgi:hypothetical protein